jgi:hypothetical protein
MVDGDVEATTLSRSPLLRAALSLEKFCSSGRYAGYMGRDKSNPWVARIVGFDDTYRYKREFQRGITSYQRANGTGSRGIFVHYALNNGIYEVNERVSWKNVKRYFIRVENAKITEITREELETCLSATLASVS